MSRFVTVGTDGLVNGFYDTSVADYALPADALEITNLVSWEDRTNHRFHRVVDGRLVPTEFDATPPGWSRSSAP